MDNAFRADQKQNDPVGKLGRRGVMLGLAAGAVVLRGRPAAAADSSWDEIARTGFLKVGVIPSRPPYFWLKNGKWVGFSAEMGRQMTAALAKEMQRTLAPKFVETTWPTVILDLQSGRVDAFYGLSYSKQRASAIDLCGPLYELPEVAVNRVGFNPGNQWTDYNKPSVRISVEMGTTDADAARRRLPHASIKGLNGMAEAVMAVQSGHTDTLITTPLVALGAMKDNPNLGQMVVLEPLRESPSYGGTRHDADGRFGKFFQKWALQYRASGECKRVILAALRAYGADVGKLPSKVTF